VTALRGLRSKRRPKDEAVRVEVQEAAVIGWNLHHNLPRRVKQSPATIAPLSGAWSTVGDGLSRGWQTAISNLPSESSTEGDRVQHSPVFLQEGRVPRESRIDSSHGGLVTRNARLQVRDQKLVLGDKPVRIRHGDVEKRSNRLVRAIALTPGPYHADRASTRGSLDGAVVSRARKMARPRPEKRDAKPTPPAEQRVLPMQLKVGDRIVDATGEYEVVGPTTLWRARPSTSASGERITPTSR
jgi:hypothetical protein